jgi:hypothetical protein
LTHAHYKRCFLQNFWVAKAEADKLFHLAVLNRTASNDTFRILEGMPLFGHNTPPDSVIRTACLAAIRQWRLSRLFFLVF